MRKAFFMPSFIFSGMYQLHAICFQITMHHFLREFSRRPFILLGTWRSPGKLCYNLYGARTTLRDHIIRGTLPSVQDIYALRSCTCALRMYDMQNSNFAKHSTVLRMNSALLPYSVLFDIQIVKWHYQIHETHPKHSHKCRSVCFKEKCSSFICSSASYEFNV